MKTLTPDLWKEYELIDSGIGEKLERYGDFIIGRPEPQALWDKALSEDEWDKLLHARFIKVHDKNDHEKGRWELYPGMREQWQVSYSYKNLNISLRLGLTAFKHLGVFPEQAENWNFIYDRLISSGIKNSRVLNLFAYTGAASLAARAAGAEVVHVDSVRQVINWANENMKNSGLDHIKWVIEDALKFVKREAKRGNIYNGIILDPPAYGRGPDGEKWILEDQINELLKYCRQIISDDHHFLVVNMYSMGFSSVLLESLVNDIFKWDDPYEAGELYLPDRAGRKLPLGIFYRA